MTPRAKRLLQFARLVGWLYFIDQYVVSKHIGGRALVVSVPIFGQVRTSVLLQSVATAFFAVLPLVIVGMVLSASLSISIKDGILLSILLVPFAYLILLVSCWILFFVGLRTGKNWVFEFVPRCLPGESPIATPIGRRRLDHLEVGDTIWAWHVSNRKLVPSVITAKIRTRQELLNLQLVDQGTLTGPDHSFLTTSGWRRASSLRPGDELVRVTENNQTQQVSVVSVSWTGRFDDVYMIVNSDEHTFLCDGIVTHNFSFLRSFRTALQHTATRWSVKRAA
jgi:hypothetical protein